MAITTLRRAAAGLAIACASLPAFGADGPRSPIGLVLILAVGLGLLALVAHVANAHVQWKRARYRPAPTVLDAPTPPPRRWPRVLALVALAIATLALLRACVRPGEGYPRDWPSIRPVALGSHGGCADIQGEYTDVDAGFWQTFGVGSRLDRWQDHYARIEQADDGRTIRVDLGVNATGLRAARGELPVRPHEGRRWQGRGRSFVLHRHTDYECKGRWIYSVARHDDGDDDFRHVDARITRDLGGGLVLGDTVEMATSVGWGDSPRIPTGHSRQTRWRRLPPRPQDDAPRVRALQALVVERTPYRNGSSIVTVVKSYFDEPLCMRMRSVTTYSRETVRETRPLGVNERRDNPHDPPTCPEGSGRIDPIGGTSMALFPPDAGAARVYVIEWGVRDATPRMWNTLRIDDVRALPGPDRED